jgi:hypothetical protein
MSTKLCSSWVGKKIIIVLVHVDDCTIAATMIALIEVFKAEIAKLVEITDIGELHWLLGIEIKHDHEKCTIHLSQRSYIDAILRRYNLQDLKPVSIPMVPCTMCIRIDFEIRFCVMPAIFGSLFG